jgi:leucyl aminopeptidase
VDFSIKSAQPEKVRAACVVVPAFRNRKLSDAARRIDRGSGGQLSRALKNSDFDGAPGATLMLFDVDGIGAARVLLLGAGNNGKLNTSEFRKSMQNALERLCSAGIADATVFVSELSVDDNNEEWVATQIAALAVAAAYRFDVMKSDTENKTGKSLSRVNLGVKGKPSRQTQKALDRGRAIGEGVNLARDLGNLPPNICTPDYLARQARKMTRTHKLRVKVLDVAQMKKLGMGSLLAVAQGSRQPAKLICIEHRGGPAKQKPVVLVGKGVTFDTGGISLKPSSEMDEMKYDMSGAGSVFGTMHSVSMMKLPLNVVGVIPAVENMPDGLATRPGDIVTSMSGQTIEILNTDAEGRLILCDALTYAERYDPATVIDIATLTGACVIALGKVATGLFSPDDKLANELVDAGQTSWDRAWRMPVWDDYQQQLHSNFADVANIGGRPAGSVTAACFLARFAKKYRWAHLDIAGTAWVSGQKKGSTGRPVPMLTQFLMTRAGW